MYKRLNFGINVAAEKFENVIATAISDLKGVKNISDNIIVCGCDEQSHDEALHALLQRL